MFPGRWPNFPESMWNFGWSAPTFTSPQSAVPPGQFCGSDPSFQPSQAQVQAQISAFQQQNALLNQQLHNQSQSHINHLQQLLPHHQVQQQPTPVPPPVQPPPSTPEPSAPEPPTPLVTTPSSPVPSAPFNPDEMLQQMKTTFETSLAVVEKSQDRQDRPHHIPHISTHLHTFLQRRHHHIVAAFLHFLSTTIPFSSSVDDTRHQRRHRRQMSAILTASRDFRRLLTSTS